MKLFTNLTNELARYSTGIYANRRQGFAALTKRARNGSLNDALALLPGREQDCPFFVRLVLGSIYMTARAV